MGLTLVEKIAARHADGLAPGAVVRSGDFISIRPRHVMTHDNTGAVIPKFKQIGATSIADPAQPVFAIDHDIQNTSPENLAKYAKIEAFATEHGIDFYPPGTGICTARWQHLAHRWSARTLRVSGQLQLHGGRFRRSLRLCLKENFRPALWGRT